MRWLKVEQSIVDLDIALKMALHHEKPDMQRCLTLGKELESLAIVPLMLKKQPEIVTTIRRMRKYVGPKNDQPDPKVKIWNKIRNGDAIYLALLKDKQA